MMIILVLLYKFYDEVANLEIDFSLLLDLMSFLF